MTIFEAAKVALEIIGTGHLGAYDDGIHDGPRLECNDCGNLSGNGHQPNCEMAANINAIKAAIEREERAG